MAESSHIRILNLTCLCSAVCNCNHADGRHTVDLSETVIDHKITAKYSRKTTSTFFDGGWPLQHFNYGDLMEPSRDVYTVTSNKTNSLISYIVYPTLYASQSVYIQKSICLFSRDTFLRSDFEFISISEVGPIRYCIKNEQTFRTSL